MQMHNTEPRITTVSDTIFKLKSGVSKLEIPVEELMALSEKLGDNWEEKLGIKE